MKWFYKDRGYFEAESQGYDETMNRTVKENPLELDDMLRNKRLL
jgi:hypothetical protein